MKVSEKITKLRSDIMRIARKHGARNLRVFGSVARGEDTDSSDLDLLIDVAPKHSPFFPGGLVMDLEELLGVQVDVVTENGLHRLIKQDVLKEAKKL
jgi:hypothetical protein